MKAGFGLPRWLGWGVCGWLAVLPAAAANDLVPVVSGAGAAATVAVGPLVLGQSAATTRAVFAARGLAPTVETPTSLQFAGSVLQGTGIAETHLAFHEDRLYQIRLVTSATHGTAPEVFAALAAVFEKTYGPPNAAPPGTGLFYVAEWTVPFAGLLKIQVDWKEDPGGTNLRYLHLPLYAARIEALRK
ncbi:MAG: hypothetical protein JXR37_13980 [Kiritimatiellae bacterium]|nr:hypothetical protein [Kiritimatiellia bacterium]